MRGVTDQSGWCILRTSGAKTLALAAFLAAEGYEAWSPVRTLKQRARGLRPKAGASVPIVEVDAPILPTFVFARQQHVDVLAAMHLDGNTKRPPFSLFRHAGRIPFVGDRDIRWLQEEEREAQALIQALRDEEDREQRRKLRAASLRTAQARRKAMRAEQRLFAKGEEVDVLDMPSMIGITGVVESSNGRAAVVVFGASLKMTIEAWQLAPRSVDVHHMAA